MSQTTLSLFTGEAREVRFVNLSSALLAEGFLPGAPAGIGKQARAVDRWLCRQLRCPHCKQPLEYFPYQRNREYKVIAACVHCDRHAEEV